MHPVRLPIHSLRAGGADCSYRSGLDLRYIRRLGRRGSSAFAIYLHLEDEIIRKLPPCFAKCECVKCDGITSKLKVRARNHQEITFGKKGEVLAAAMPTNSGHDSEGGRPTTSGASIEMEGRGIGAISRNHHRGRTSMQ